MYENADAIQRALGRSNGRDVERMKAPRLAHHQLAAGTEEGLREPVEEGHAVGRDAALELLIVTSYRPPSRLSAFFYRYGGAARANTALATPSLP